MLRRKVEKLNLRGLKLHKIPVLYHPKEVTDYHMIAEEFPQIPFIMAHMGGYRTWLKPMEGIGLARRYPNVFVDTSQVPVKLIERAVKEMGAGKIVV